MYNYFYYFDNILNFHEYIKNIILLHLILIDIKKFSHKLKLETLKKLFNSSL